MSVWGLLVKAAQKCSGRDEQGNPITTIGDAFFQDDEMGRRLLLKHEEGHDLMRDFNKDWKDVLEPIRKNPETP